MVVALSIYSHEQNLVIQVGHMFSSFLIHSISKYSKTCVKRPFSLKKTESWF